MKVLYTDKEVKMLLAEKHGVSPVDISIVNTNVFTGNSFFEHLDNNERLLAIKAIREMKKCTLSEAMEFTKAVQALYYKL